MAEPSTITGILTVLPASTLLSRPVVAAKRAVDAGSFARSAVFFEWKVKLVSMRVEAAATLTLRLTDVVSLYSASPDGTLNAFSPNSGSSLEPTLVPLR